MKRSFHRDKFRHPELFLQELLESSVKGNLSERDENSRVFYRALVVAVDVIGGRLENTAGTGKMTHVINSKSLDVPACIGPTNPMNSIKARILTDGSDQFISDDRLRVFWPFFPEHISIPIKPGEHVYVLFEDENFEHGLWFSKISGHAGVNRSTGEKTYKKGSGGLSDLFPETRSAQHGRTIDTDKDASEVLSNDRRLTDILKL